MGGIPRSKGCENCKERKVKVRYCAPPPPPPPPHVIAGQEPRCFKATGLNSIQCDQGKPTCARCEGSRRKCKGYRKHPILFVNSSSAPITHNAVTHPPKQLNPGPVTIDHLLALFLHDYVPKSHNSITHSHEYGLSWAQYMPSITDKSQVLTQSLAAVSLSIVGRSHRDEKLIKRSFEVYGSAINSLRGVLRRHEGKHTQDTLASMMAMTVYELWQPTFKTGRGWMAHVQGASRIMETLRPISSQPQTPLSACLMSHFRTSSIFEALGRRRPYLWDRENWSKGRTVAPKLNDKLLDIVADVPALFAETDDLLDNDAQEPAFTIQRICIMQRYTVFQEQLQKWYEGAQELTSGPVYYESTDMNNLVDMDNFPFEPRLIQFLSQPLAQLVVIYWTARSMLYAEMDRLASSYKSSASTSRFKSTSEILEPPTNTFATSAIAFADLCIRAEPFCTHISHGMSGVQSVAFTMWALQHHVYFNRSLEKEAYCNRRALELGKNKGLYFLSQVTNLSCEEYKDMGKHGLNLEILDDEEIQYFDRMTLETFDYGSGNGTGDKSAISEVF